jgi:hypothetical protein
VWRNVLIEHVFSSAPPTDIVTFTSHSFCNLCRTLGGNTLQSSTTRDKYCVVYTKVSDIFKISVSFKEPSASQQPLVVNEVPSVFNQNVDDDKDLVSIINKLCDGNFSTSTAEKRLWIATNITFYLLLPKRTSYHGKHARQCLLQNIGKDGVQINSHCGELSGLLIAIVAVALEASYETNRNVSVACETYNGKARVMESVPWSLCQTHLEKKVESLVLKLSNSPVTTIGNLAALLWEKLDFKKGNKLSMGTGITYSVVDNNNKKPLISVINRECAFLLRNKDKKRNRDINDEDEYYQFPFMTSENKDAEGAFQQKNTMMDCDTDVNEEEDDHSRHTRKKRKGDRDENLTCDEKEYFHHEPYKTPCREVERCKVVTSREIGTTQLKMERTGSSPKSFEVDLYPIYGKCVPPSLQPFTAKFKEDYDTVQHIRTQFYWVAARYPLGDKDRECSVSDFAGDLELGVVEEEGDEFLRPGKTLSSFHTFREAWMDNSMFLKENGNGPRLEGAFVFKDPSKWKTEGLKTAFHISLSIIERAAKHYSTNSIIDTVQLFVDTITSRAFWALKTLEKLAKNDDSFCCTAEDMKKSLVEIAELCYSFYHGRRKNYSGVIDKVKLWKRYDRPHLSALPLSKCTALQNVVFQLACENSSFFYQSSEMQGTYRSIVHNWMKKNIPMIDPASTPDSPLSEKIEPVIVCDCCMKVSITQYNDVC